MNSMIGSYDFHLKLLFFSILLFAFVFVLVFTVYANCLNIATSST